MMKSLIMSFLTGMAMTLTACCSTQDDMVVNQMNLESFKSLSVSSHSNNVKFEPSDHFGLEVRKFKDDVDPIIKSDNQTTEISFNSESSHRKCIGIKESPYIKIYFPASEKFENIKITTNSGNIKIDSVLASKFEIDSSSGNIGVNFKDSENIKISSESGNIDLNNNSTLPTDLKLNTSSGNLCLSGNKWNNINIEKTSGNLKMIGDFEGYCDISSDSGNTNLKLSGAASEYNYNISAKSGNIMVKDSDKKLPNSSPSLDSSAKKIKIKSKSGNVLVNFKS